MLEFLSASFVHPGALLPSYRFQHQLEHKNIENWKIFNKLFFLTTITSELSNYLNEQLVIFLLNVKQQN